MSRIGKHPVAIPAGVDFRMDGRTLRAKGTLGELSMVASEEVTIEVADGRVSVQPRTESRRSRNMWATTRTLIQNLVTGVSAGFSKRLEISGVGYRAAVDGKALVLQLGYSHEIRYPIPDGITMKCERPTLIEISGADKQRVGQIAAEIRGYRGPEPFKGKGIKYENERILRKEGKKK